MLGAGGSYLAFITGNLINMKIPCAINARDIVGVKAGTPENEIVSTLAIATPALTATLVVALGGTAPHPAPAHSGGSRSGPALDNVVPALFGALAYRYFRKDMRVAALPLAVMAVVFVAVPSLICSVGFLIIPSGAMAIGMAWVLFKRDNKKEEEEK